MAEYIKRVDVMKICESYSEHCFNSSDASGQDIADRILDDVVETPTADVVEVKHSRWEKKSGFYVCNICGTSPAYWEPEPNNPKGYPPYCHNCGAKMDERRDT